MIDPERGDAILTEDASGPNGLVYRFRPTDRSREYGALRNGGALTAMRCTRRDVHVPDLSVFSQLGTTLRVEWVPVPDPSAATTSLRKQFADTEVTRGRKFEGAWWDDTSGSDRRDFLFFGHGRGGGEAHIVCSFAAPQRRLVGRTRRPGVGLRP